jgi:predicted protein tyrosine phosphatase
MNDHHRLHVLFVCTMNRDRSATAEQLYRDDPRLEVRSAGVSPSAKRRVSAADLRWADVLFVMEREHQERIQSQFADFPLPSVTVLDIPDEYRYMDPELQRVLKTTVDPEIEALLKSHGGR